MKLKNKKTGEIKECVVLPVDENGYPNEYQLFDKGKSLAELNEEWEDAPEGPKEYWYIESDGSIIQNHKPTYINHLLDGLKSIGNYFETKEEAEKGVEKLKAWKRLEDKGFRFVGVRGIGKVIDFDMPKPYHHVAFDEYNANEDELEFYNDLMLLFGGEE